MKNTSPQKRNPIQIAILAIISVGLAIFIIAVDLAQEVYYFLQHYVSDPLHRTFINLIFAILLGLILVSYRQWRNSYLREKKLSSVIDGISPDSLLVVSDRGQIQLANRSAERLLGYSNEEILTLSIDSLITNKSSEIQDFSETSELLLKEGFNLDISEVKRKDGSGFPAEIISSRLESNMGMVVLIRDISERKDFQHQIFEFKKRLEEIVYKQKTELHDTKNSLIREIDQHRSSKLQIQQLSQFHEGIIDHAKIWMNVLDKDANVVLWNRAAEEISGYQRDEVVGNSSIWDKVYSPETGEKVRLHVIDAMKNGTEIDEFETTIKSKRGDKKIISWSSRLINNDKGVATNVVYIGREVTLEKAAYAQAEKRLEEMKLLSESSIAFMEIRSNKALYEFINEGLGKLTPSSSIFITTVESDALEFTISAARQFEKIRSIIKKNLDMDILEAKYKLNNEIALRALLSGRLIKLPGIGDITTLSFGRIPVELSEFLERELDFGYIYTIGLISKKKIYGSVVIITVKGEDLDNPDIIESFINQASVALQRIRVENQLIEAKKSAERANIEKSRFLANMSHELRTPLSGLLGMTEIVLRSGLDPQNRANIKMAHESAQDLLRIVNNILDLSKIEAGEMKLAEEPFSVRHTITSVRNKMVILARRKDIKFTVEIKSNVPDCVIGDDYRLEQVLLNLVSNAIKFTDEGSVKLAVETLPADDTSTAKLRFEIVDTGIGIPPEKIDMIFESYQQADSSIKHKKGTGLGIAIAKSIVILMNSSIEVESAQGKGSNFHFTASFPIVEKD